MYAYLRVVSGPDQGKIFNLVEGTTLSIGRGEKTDTRLTDGAAARLHCELRCAGGEFVLADRDSINGTLVGGQKIEEHALKHGEEFEIGNTRMKLYTSAVADTQKLVEAEKSAFHRVIRIDESVLTGTTLSHYELGAILARGSFGTVYKARNTRDGKDVAINVLHPDFSQDEANLKRFMRVMKTAVGLRHPNLVGLCGAGKQGEICWFAREYVEGEPLIKVIERLGTRKMISWRYTVTLGVQIAGALEALHEKHIIHRNVTPESIQIRSKDKVAKLGDIMLAEVVDGTEARTPSRPGELLGNVTYMAPERTRGDAEVDIRSDIYSLGATLYTLLTGRPPFEGKTLVETVAKIRQEDPIPPKRFQDAIPDELQDVVEKMLAKRPELRYQTPAHVLRALGRVVIAQAPTSDPNKSAFIRMPSNPETPVG
jgi:serine/threonine protein kinase